MVNVKKVKNILHIVIWAFSVAAGVLLAIGIDNDNQGVLNQFADTIVFGEIFITTILFAMLFLDEEVPEKSFYLLTIAAAILFIIAGAVLVFNNTGGSSSSTLLLLSGILTLAVGAIFLFEFIASLIKKDMLN